MTKTWRRPREPPRRSARMGTRATGARMGVRATVQELSATKKNGRREITRDHSGIRALLYWIKDAFGSGVKSRASSCQTAASPVLAAAKVSFASEGGLGRNERGGISFGGSTRTIQIGKHSHRLASRNVAHHRRKDLKDSCRRPLFLLSGHSPIPLRLRTVPLATPLGLGALQGPALLLLTLLSFPSLPARLEACEKCLIWTGPRKQRCTSTCSNLGDAAAVRGYANLSWGQPAWCNGGELRLVGGWHWGMIVGDARAVVLNDSEGGHHAVGDECDYGRLLVEESSGLPILGTCATCCTTAMEFTPIGLGMDDFGFLGGFLGRHPRGRKHSLLPPLSHPDNMNHAQVAFAVNAQLPAPLQTPTPAIYIFFSDSPTTATPNAIRAAAQARYHEKNKEQEQSRARIRMARLHEIHMAEGVHVRQQLHDREDASVAKLAHQEERDIQKEEQQMRCQASQELRSSTLFKHFKDHVQRHVGQFFGDAAGNYVYFEPSQAEIERRVASVWSCALVLHLDKDAVGYGRLLTADAENLDDEDIKFIFAHSTPTPTLEGLDACACF
ncbi:hypothetical protein FB451DRAFT_1171988 [Mycena latifolia]|nr:hypothetical protein FB451DRAFT_1171988 [Mycena latifolia]